MIPTPSHTLSCMHYKHWGAGWWPGNEAKPAKPSSELIISVFTNQTTLELSIWAYHLLKHILATFFIGILCTLAPTKGFTQPTQDIAMLFSPFGWTLPSPPVLAFLVMKNLSPVGITGSDITELSLMIPIYILGCEVFNGNQKYVCMVLFSPCDKCSFEKATSLFETSSFLWQLWCLLWGRLGLEWHTCSPFLAWRWEEA